MLSRWSCLVDSFAITLGIEAHKLINMIGHDGSAIKWPHRQEPTNRQGFHIQELILVCYKLGYAVVQFDPHPMLAPAENEVGHVIHFNLGNIYDTTEGVFTGSVINGRHRHAVAWKNQKMVDPAGFVKEVWQFEIEDYWCVLPIQSR